MQNAPPRRAVKKQPATFQHHAKHQAYSSATLPIYCFHSPRTGVSCDPTPIAFYCACHTIVLPYMLQGQLRPYPPHRGRVTTDSEEVGSQPTPLPIIYLVLGGSSHDRRKWLVTMVIVSPRSSVVGPLPNLLTGMILQVGRGHPGYRKKITKPSTWLSTPMVFLFTIQPAVKK